MQKIVVTGGTGFIGRAVCERLFALNPGCRLVVPTRRRNNGRPLSVLPTVDLLPNDVHDADTLPGLLAGADALVHLVAILHGDAAAFDRVHRQLPEKLAAACTTAGVRRVVHISALGVDASAPSAYLRSKAAGEAAWQQAAAAGGFDLHVLRPSVVFGAEDHFTNLFAGLLRRFPVLPLAGAEARFQPVAVGDVASAVAACLQGRAPTGVLECAGPEVLTLRQIVQQVGALAGHPRPVIGLPEWAGLLQAAAMAWLPGEPLVSRDNLLSLRVPSVASGTLPGLASLGIAPAALRTLATHFNPPDPRRR